MDDKRKIILGSKDVLANGVDDIFININLQHTFNQIKKDKYDNNFDLSEQFRKERNLSRDFRIYGIIDSNIIDTDNISIDIYKDSGLTQFYSTLTTTPLVYEEKNVFNKKRGKYIIELNNYDSDVVFVKITGNNITYADQVFEQRVVFYTVDGDFVEYGTKTVDIGLVTQGFSTIENDFPFFYNKHWVKKDIEIIETKKAIVNFTTSETFVNEGETKQITISLDKPSPFGNELLDFDYKLVNAKVNDFSTSISGNSITLPTTLSWNNGEQSKTFDFKGLNDNFQELPESLFLNLSNFKFVDSGETIINNVTIYDETPRNYSNYNFGEIYRNRYAFTGRTYNNYNNNILNASSFSILRNGLYYERRNEEFYPNDDFTISITNKGSDSILPINNSLDISNEESFLSGETKLFEHLKVQYTGDQVQELKVIFSGSGGNSTNSNSGDMIINGIKFISNRGINYPNAKEYLTNKNILTIKGLETPFEFKFDDADKVVYIKSKSPGVPVDFSTKEYWGPGGSTSPIESNKIPIIEEISSFVIYKQKQISIRLAANSSSNTRCLYEIIIRKHGFDDIKCDALPIVATQSGTEHFLISNIKLVMRDWDASSQSCTLIEQTTVDTNIANQYTFYPPTQQTPNPINFVMPIGDAYINGSILFSNNNLYENRRNESYYISASFYKKKLLIKPCTTDSIVQNSVAQITKLTIPPIGDSNSNNQQLLQTNAIGLRSFYFRTGTTGAYTIISHSNNNFIPSSDLKWGSTVSANGGTYGGVNAPMSTILDNGNLPLIKIGPVDGQDANGNTIGIGAQEIYLKSKTPGIPFEIKNIVNAYVHTSFGTYSSGDIIGEITTKTIVPNLTAGIGHSPANNYLGGFNTTLQFAP